MPLKFDVTDDIVNITATGTITYQEVVDLIAMRAADPERVPGLPVLVDGRGVQGAPSAAELRLLASDIKPLIDRGMGPIAVITDSAWIYGIVRMFSVFAHAMSASVTPFRRPEEAEQWLAMQRQAA